MTRSLSRSLLVVLATASSIPSAGFAEPVQRPDAVAAADGLAADDREALAAAQQLATTTAQLVEGWIATGAISEDRLFSRLYFAIPRTNPQRFSTPYDALAERDLVGPEDQTLALSSAFHYAIVTDVIGYVPAHNTRFTQPLTGDLEHDYVNNRTKRMYGDVASLTAAHSRAPYLIQRVRLDAGDLINEVSVPVVVRGRQWGCVRIGYHHTR